jgi:hypothetical protein
MEDSIMNIIPILAAEPGPIQSPHWWEIIGGIIAIPTGLIGLFSSWVLIQKTRLENVKLTKELENEKPKPSEHRGQAKAVALYRLRTIPYLLLRYVLLQLVLSMWGCFSDVYGFLLEGIGMGFALAAQHWFEHGSEMYELWLFVPYKCLTFLPTIGHWLIFFGIGLPLFRDANALIGIDLKNLLSWKGVTKSWKEVREVRKFGQHSE